MNKGLLGFISFALGAAAGSLITWKLLDNKYKVYADQEIEEVKRRYIEEYGDPVEKQRLEDETAEINRKKAEDIREYAAIAAKAGYINYSDSDAAVEAITEKRGTQEKEVDNSHIHLVEATDRDDEYDIVTLNYYADGVLTDLAGELIEDIDGTVGANFADYFDDGLEDCIYIRNDKSKIEYEILYDPRRFSDLKPSNPR